MHSDLMRTGRILTVSRSAGGGGSAQPPLEADPLPHPLDADPLPPTQTFDLVM